MQFGRPCFGHKLSEELEDKSLVFLLNISDLSFHVPMDVISGGSVGSAGVTTTVQGSPGMLQLIYMYISLYHLLFLFSA